MSKHYYFTTDTVNAVTAEQLAELKGLALEVVDPRDLSRLQRERADLILDWDHSPEEERQFLLSNSAVNVVGVHGFNLSEALSSFLLRRGLVCSSRLDESFFDALDARSNAA